MTLKDDIERVEQESKSLHVDKDLEEKLLVELEGQRVFEKGVFAYVVAIACFCWSVFQLYATYFPINSTIVRSIHLAFAMFLAFIVYPVFKRPRFLEKVAFYDFILAILGILGASYIAFNFASLAERAGAYFTRDILIGIIFIIVLLEAGRRVIGPALSLVGIFFLVYDIFGPYFPELIAHKGVSSEKLVSHIYLTTEGIFGVPLGVSASFVFLFVLFGSLLERAGAGEYFIKLAYALLGRYVGGPAKAAVVASGLTGIVSGSSTANVVTTGVFTIPLMKKAGFPPEKAGAIEVAASTNGQLMPPVMGAAAFIIAEFLGLSYLKIVISAAIPAVVSYMGLLYIVHLEAKKLGLKGEDPSKLPPRLKTFLSGLHYFIPVIYLLYVLVVLRHSPSSACFSAIWLLMVIMLIQHPVNKLIRKEKVDFHDFFMGLYDIFHGMVLGARNMIPIALATAIAGIVVGSITLTGIGQVFVEVIDSISRGNILLVLVFTAFVSLILGMGLPTTANYIIVSSLAAPVILQLSADNGFLIPAIAAHLFVFYFGILADDTPPVGIAAYAAASIARANPIKTGIQGFVYDMRTAILPFAFFFNHALLLVASVDEFDPARVKFISNPFEIFFVFMSCLMGMLTFASAVQGYFLTRLNILQRIFLLFASSLFFIPNIWHRVFQFATPHLCFVLAFIIVLFIFMSQKRLSFSFRKAEKTLD